MASTASLRSLRALSFAIIVIYLAVLFDVYDRFNGVDFWVMILVFSPLHLLFTLAPSYYSKTKWVLSIVALVVLLVMILTEIHQPFAAYFYSVALVYMLNMLALLILAGLSLISSSDQAEVESNE